MAYFPCNNNEPEELYKKVRFDVTLSKYAAPTGKINVNIKNACPNNYMDLKQENFIVAPYQSSMGNYVAPSEKHAWYLANITAGSYDSTNGILPISVTSSYLDEYYSYASFSGYVYVIGGE